MKFSIFFILLALPIFATAGIYKWTDENGVVHYGERPAENSNATSVAIQKKTQSKANEQARQERLKREKRLSDALDAERREKEAKQAERREEIKGKKLACKKLRNELKDLERSYTIFYELDDDGERVILTDEQIQEKQEELREQIKKNCKNY